MITYGSSEQNGVCIYIDGELAMQAISLTELEQIAKDALAGQIIVPAYPDPVPIVDHRTLFLIAGSACNLAANRSQ